MSSSVNSGFASTHAQTAPLSLRMAVVVLTLVPLVIVYPFVQKHLPAGVLNGAIERLSRQPGPEAPTDREQSWTNTDTKEERW